jgi:hypothetical protein
VKAPIHNSAPRLTVPVNEVSITFHVSDSRGSAIDNLTRDDSRLLDNGQPQKKLLSLESYHNLSIRAGFLFGTSKGDEITSIEKAPRHRGSFGRRGV